MKRRPPRSTRTDTLFPYTTLFRSLPRSRSCSDCISKRGRLSVKNGGEAKDLLPDFEAACDAHIRWRVRFRSAIHAPETREGRESVVYGQSVSGRVDLGGRRILKYQNTL